MLKREGNGREGRAGQEGRAALGTTGTSETLVASSPSRPPSQALLTGREGRAGQEGRATLGTTGTSGTFVASSPSRPSCPPSPMRRYPRYKPTGLAWIPSVPEHWEATKIRTVFTERTTKVSDKEYPPLSVSKGGVVPQIETVAKSDDSDNRKLVRVGDFVINSRSDRKGSSGVSELDGSVSLVNLVLKPRKQGNGRFLHYLLKSDPFVEEFYRNGHGIVADLWTTRYSEMKSIYIPLPPPSEQDRIVRYLDEKTAAIDELVRAKEREIDLLRERKQALVSDAVTGGLDPATERKDSGVPWIGTIPKEWKVAKTGHLFHMVLGKMLANTPSSPTDTLERYACAKDVHFSGVDTSDLKEMWFSPEEKRLYRTRHGDLLIVEGGAGAGGAAIVEDDGGYCIQNSIHLLRSKHDLGWTPFLKYWVYSLVSRGYIEHACNKATIPHFTKDKVFNMPIPVPPLPEQERIVAHLDSVCSELDAAEAAIRKQIALLQELRTRLVSDAVTGTVEVG